MIDLFTKMLSELTFYKTSKSCLKALYHFIRALWQKHKIMKIINSKERLSSNDIYNCIFIIQHSSCHTINYPDATFESYFSATGASLRYICNDNEEDLFIHINKVPHKKELSSIDIDCKKDSITCHYSTDYLEQESWPATIVITVLEEILLDILTRGRFDD